MKVAHIVRQYIPSIGGMEEVVRNLAGHQRQRGTYLPSVITLDRLFRAPDAALPAEAVIDGIPVFRLGYRGSERYPFCPHVLQHLADYDLVHVHGVDFFFDFLSNTRWLHGKPLIASTHGGFFHTAYAARLKRIFFHSATRTSCLGYRRIVGTSQNDGDIFRAITSAPRLQVIENGVDVDKFHEAGSPALRPAIVYFGRWSVNKGLHETLQMFAALCDRQPQEDWSLRILGREYDLSAEQLRQQAEQLGISHRVHVHANPSNAEIREALAQASYFVSLSHHEGFGIAPIEAMSAGLQPLLSPIPPFEKLVRETGCGLLLTDADPVSQAVHIVQWHQQARQSGDVAYTECRRRAMNAAQRYSWSEVGRLYDQQYAQVLGKDAA